MKNITDISNKLYSNKSNKEILDFKKRATLKTGIQKIDNNFDFPYGYYLIMGNPGIGKSWFAIWLTRVFYKYNQINSVFFSLEMTEQAVRSRILQQWSDLTRDKFFQGESTQRAIDLLIQDPIIVDTFFENDTKKRTPQNFEAMVDEYYTYGYRVFHFDHLHELDGTTDNNTNQKVTGEWGNTFQKISKKYDDIWLFIFAQPNSEASKKKIIKRTDILGSKSITYKADYIMSINKGFDVDDWGIPMAGEDPRGIMLYLDKTRYTDPAHIGFKLMLDETGNFRSKDI